VTTLITAAKETTLLLVPQVTPHGNLFAVNVALSVQSSCHSSVVRDRTARTVGMLVGGYNTHAAISTCCLL